MAASLSGAALTKRQAVQAVGRAFQAAANGFPWAGALTVCSSSTFTASPLAPRYGNAKYLGRTGASDNEVRGRPSGEGPAKCQPILLDRGPTGIGRLRNRKVDSDCVAP